ncbi:MAG: hypothetical protein IT299_11280 [Dehalococcoidia bacterium]|nr:hypothetical protein [Dehalococcoidia bacterium]
MPGTDGCAAVIILAMPSERIQRQIDALLDEAEALMSRREWRLVAEKARAVLAMDPDDEDAPSLLRAAEANLGAAQATVDGPLPRPPRNQSFEHPASFVAGRYEVRRFLGEGARSVSFSLTTCGLIATWPSR